MTEPDQPPRPDRLLELVEEGAHGGAVAYLDRLGAAETETRKRALRALRDVATERPRSIEELVGPLSTFLTDEDRAARLTTAKLFVTLAEFEPEVVRPAIDTLADRLADDDEFYYVRARCAEALGYIGRNHPELVSDPAVLADFRIGLSFDEPEVKEKLAKALEYVALGDSGRLAHLVSSLTEHLDDEQELVRYHLCTALVLIGCDAPETLAEARDALAARLTDENAYVQGRAAEALGLLARAATTDPSFPESELVAVGDEAEAFAAERAQFALEEIREGDTSADSLDGISTIEAIRGTTQEIVEDITAPDTDDTCPHCGLALPGNGPPMCPRCGAPY
jgi:rubrerythrin